MTFATFEIDENDPQLYTHKKRPEWGTGLLTGEAEHRRTLQFEDGRVRKFKDGFYHLLEPLDEGPAASATLAEELLFKYRKALQDEADRRGHGAQPPMSFDTQVRVFASLFAGGFHGSDYVESFRTAADGRGRKRLRDPAIAVAQDLLAADRLADLVDKGLWGKLHSAAIKVLSRTSLASPSKVVEPLREMPDAFKERFGRALFALLHGGDPGDLQARFREWILALDAEGHVRVSWPMATVLPALFAPDRHVPVKWRVFRAQAQIVDPHVFVRQVPTPGGYLRARDLAVETGRRLADAGLEPRDLLDVREFIWQTLRPRGQEIALELKA
ncbi:MAG: hypothetical protein H6742_11875 [Alphaproteobacteria bacterium]|nr:hypothetical protein [Alphaproteobacteria bacterium]